MTTPAPITRFLGEASLAHGPFSLLGLTPERLDDASIEQALRRQLERIGRHPHAGSPEADEVRLALHVAAAQLRDPSVRDELLSDLAAARGSAATLAPAATGEPAATPWLGDAGQAGDRAFERMALWVLAHSGGWNREARRRLGALAGAYQIDACTLRETMARLAPARRKMSEPPARSEPPADPAGADGTAVSAALRPAPRPASPLRRWASPVLLVLLLISTLVMARTLVTLRAGLAARQGPLESPPAMAPPAPPASRRVAPRAEPVPAPDAPTAQPRARSAPPASGQPRTERPPAPRTARLDEAAERWAARARQLTRPDPHEADSAGAAPSIEALAQAVRLAIINQAAAQQWKGDTQAAEASLRQAAAFPVPRERGSPEPGPAPVDLGRLTSPGVGTDGKLALQVLALRRQPGAVADALKQLRLGREPMGPVDCDVVAEAALVGSPQELRLWARRAVTEQASNPAMINALLEALPRAPQQAPVSVLIEQVAQCKLPELESAAWPARARAALVRRLVDLIGASEFAGFDQLSAELTGVYEATVAALDQNSASGPTSSAAASPLDEPDAGPQTASSASLGPVATGPARIAALLRARWSEMAPLLNADPQSAHQIEALNHRASVRIGLAQGPVQRFAAEQAAIVDLMALVVGQERPTMAQRIAVIRGDYTAEQRRAGNIFAQVRAGERAVARLWLARFGAPDDETGRSP